MADLKHTWGHDLSLSASGGLALSTGVVQGQERIVRRLLTNPGADIWSPDYGAGLPAQVGSPSTARRLKASILKQMRQEAAVSQITPPVVDVTLSGVGTAAVVIKYVDRPTGQPSAFSLPVTRNA